MSDEVELPSLIVKTDKSEFRLRCHAAAWSGEYGGSVQMYRRHSQDYPGLLLFSATGPDTAAKSVRATLYEPDVRGPVSLDWPNDPRRCSRQADFDGKPVTYNAAVAKLAPGAIHLVALAKIPGLMPNISDDHLWSELSGPRYTTPLLRSWIPWLKDGHDQERRHHRRQRLLRPRWACWGPNRTIWTNLVLQGVRDRHLALCG